MKNFLVLVCVVGLHFYVLSQSYYQWVERADSCIKAKDWAGAESAVVSALRTEPANGQNSLLMSNLGTVQRYAGNYEAALRSYTNGLLMTPHSVTLLRNRAALFSEIDSIDRAYQDYSQILLIDDADEVPIGYSDVPEIVNGMGVSMNYKGFDLSLFFQGVARTTFFLGDAYFPFNYPNIGRTGFLDDLKDKYFDPAKQNFDAEIPLLYDEGWHGSNYKNSTWWQRSGAFLRLKTAELGYTLPKSVTQNMRLKTVRFFVSGTNLLTFAKDVKLWDPEINSTDGRGYPLMRTANFGVNINF